MGVKKEPQGEFKFNPVNLERIRIGIVVSEWNKTITGSLLEACVNTLKKFLIPEENIQITWVPGSFELPLAAQWLVEYNNVDTVICLGCIIKGETPHFHYISQTVTNNIGELSLKFGRPFIFGVLTTENEEHALARAGGKAGNKGEEAALAALKMLQLKSDIKKSGKNIGYF